MKRFKARRIVVVCVVLIAINGVLGLWFNIQTEPINRDLELERQEIKKLQETVRELQLEYYRKTQLRYVEAYAVEKLGMVAPRSVRVYVIPAPKEELR